MQERCQNDAASASSFLCVLNKMVARNNLRTYDRTRLFYTVRVRPLLQDALHELRYEFENSYRNSPRNFASLQAARRIRGRNT